MKGRVRGALASLRPDLNKGAGLVKDRLTDEQLAEWHGLIERLAEDFVAGRAEVDPKKPGTTCESCHLQAVCRIHEQQQLAMELDGEDEEGFDEGEGASEGEDG
jgi:hypothetical protein